MAAFHCTRCAFDFASDEARCPRCMRKSSVVDAAPREKSAGERHLFASQLMMFCFIAVSLLSVASVAINVALMRHGFMSPASQEEAYGSYGTFACIGAWALIGLVWTPLNAWGLFRRKKWARISSVLYWAGSFLTLCCIPFGIYGIYSLMRADVKELFE
jgi:hypothetical protein